MGATDSVVAARKVDADVDGFADAELHRPREARAGASGNDDQHAPDGVFGEQRGIEGGVGRPGSARRANLRLKCLFPKGWLKG